VGVHIRTSYRWCWWLRNAALSYEMHHQLGYFWETHPKGKITTLAFFC
jgi:hypothetical protein